MRDKYWAMYTSIKHAEYYYESYQVRAKRFNTAIDGFCLLFSLGSVAGWGIWNKAPALWAIIIALAQVISALKPSFPFSKQISATKFLIPEITSLLNEIDFYWCWEETQGMTEKECLKMIYKFNKRFNKLELKYISNDYFPLVKSCDKDAEIESKKFFYHTYGVQ